MAIIIGGGSYWAQAGCGLPIFWASWAASLAMGMEFGTSQDFVAATFSSDCSFPF